MKLKKLLVRKQKNLKQPVGGLIDQPLSETAHILGAAITLDKINPGGHWGDLDVPPELQRNKYGDTYMCTCFSTNNCHEFLWLKQYKELLDFSDIFLGRLAGVVRGRGSSFENVFETKRKKFCVWESEYPYTQEMTLDQVYQDLPQSLKDLALSRLPEYTIKYQFLSNTNQATLKDALEYSPVTIAVEGKYNWKNGKVTNSGIGYNHAVLLIDYKDGDHWLIFDSESQQVLKFDWNYKFSSGAVHSLKKKAV